MYVISVHCFSRATSLWFKLGQALLHICQRAEDPAHGDFRPQIWWKDCELAIPYSFYITVSLFCNILNITIFFQGETESVTLKSCVRKTTDMLDRRFCLDLDITDRYVMTSHTGMKLYFYGNIMLHPMENLSFKRLN